MRSFRFPRGSIGNGRWFGPAAFAAFVVAALVAAAACRSSDAPKPGAQPALPEGFELISPGAEPRAPLRYQLTAGTRARSTLRILAEPIGMLRTSSAVRFTTELEVLPAIAGDPTLPVTLRVIEAHPDGGAPDGTGSAAHPDGASPDGTGSAAPAGSAAPPAAIPATTQDALARLRGLEMRATVSPLGKLDGLALRSAAAGDAPAGDAPTGDVPAEDDAELQTLSTTMQQLAVELPGADVGVGASWAVERPFPQGGLVLKARSVYQLLERTTTTVHLRSQIAFSAPDQQLQQGALTAELTGFSGQGEGDLTIDLTNLTATGTTVSSYRGRVTSEGRTVELGMKLSVTIGRQ